MNGEEDVSIGVAVVNSPLKPTQIFHLQNAWDLTVFDRTRLILEIFSNRARSQEARLQVELAKLEYEVPLVKELIHRSKMGEHPGYMAGGEYQVDQYHEMIKRRIKKIKERLDTVKKDREEIRRHRREEGFFLVSIAGYTNAGKSMLLRALTDERIVVEEQFFSTLYTLTRKGERDKAGSFLFSDTVGFIRDLPPWLVDAFHSTLEEIFFSDIILLVVDMSENIDEMVNKVLTSYRFLRYQNETPPVVMVFNKMDLVKDEVGRETKISYVVDRLEKQNVPFLGHQMISAKEEEGIDELLDLIHECLLELDYVERISFTLDRRKHSDDPSKIERLINWIYDNQMVISSEHRGNTVSFVLMGKKGDLAKLEQHAKEREITLES